MRAAEGINLCFFLLFAVFAWLRPLTLPQRARICGFGAAGILLTLAAVAADRFLPGSAGSILRDWLPAPLMLIVYWQVGGFFTRPNEAIQKKLLRVDEQVLSIFRRMPGSLLANGWLKSYLELTYLLCYPLIPLGVGVLYGTHRRSGVEEYWAIVLPATYLCYTTLPFFQTLPPRSLLPGGAPSSDPGPLRRLNEAVLGRASIQVNTLPSAHVASTFAAALALVHVAGLAGCVFLFLALSIALAVIVGRYHYAVDSLLALLLALLVYLFHSFVRYG